MFRRTFIAAASAVGLTACAGAPKESASTPAASSSMEFLLVDAQTPFGSASKPYLEALREEKPADDTELEWVTLEDYGREGGAMVRAPVVAVAEERAQLEAYFSALPPQWQLPATHGIRFEHGSWLKDAGPPRWGARVVRLPPVATASDLLRAEAQDGSVWLQLDAAGAKSLEETSADNIGQRLAIVIDDEIVARPIINARIRGGKVQISLQGGPAENEALAERIAAG